MKTILAHTKAKATAYTIRREKLDGRSHIVVPVVMMVEGVHNGSHGPLLHTAQELGHVIGAWNGIPVTILHPTDNNGQNISANSPGVPYVGRIYNAYMDGVKLKAEAWIDETKLLATSPLASAYISQGRPLDVSIGVFTDEEPIQGEWNGEQYTAIARNHRPDHLALLPGEQGACSWADGCGVRTNKKGGTDETINEKPSTNKKGGVISEFTELETKTKLYGKMNEIEKFNVIREQAIEQIQEALLQANQLSLTKRVDKLYELVHAMDVYDDANDRYQLLHGIEDVYDNYIVFRKMERDAKGVRQETYMRQAYTVNADDSVALIDTPIQVRKDVNYVQINDANPPAEDTDDDNVVSKRTKFSNNKNLITMSKPSACLIKKVDALIANSAVQFGEDDREFLLTQSEAILEKMLPKEVETPPTPQVNADQVQAYIRETFQKPEEFVRMLPSEMQDQMNSALKLHASKRKTLVADIIANTAEGTWSEEELVAMKTEMLEKIGRSVQANKQREEEAYDYSGNGGTFQANAESGDDDVLLPTGYGKKK